MKVLFLNGWHSFVGGVKPTYIEDGGHELLDDADFDAAVRSAHSNAVSISPMCLTLSAGSAVYRACRGNLIDNNA
ncbi:MAG: hypothetical protein Fues2KO_46740 [Fuerstiella sp.]